MKLDLWLTFNATGIEAFGFQPCACRQRHSHVESRAIPHPWVLAKASQEALQIFMLRKSRRPVANSGRFSDKYLAVCTSFRVLCWQRQICGVRIAYLRPNTKSFGARALKFNLPRFSAAMHNPMKYHVRGITWRVIM